MPRVSSGIPTGSSWCRSSRGGPVLSASTRLTKKIELALPGYGLPGRLLLEHPRARDVYPRYLAVGYHVSVAMIRLLETALARARELSREDEVAAGLVDYLERHLVDETHSPEPGGAVLDDLSALGVHVEDFRARLPSPKIAELVGALYFWILHYHPVAVLGYVQLEAYHPDGGSVELLIERTGLPREAFGQLLLHAELDVGHAAEFREVLDSLPLEPRHEELIGLSTLHSMSCLMDALLEIVEADAVLA